MFCALGKRPFAHSQLQIQSGDNCASVSIQQNIALDDFYFLNPEINDDCTNLLLDLSYCIAPVGTICTYKGYAASVGACSSTAASSIPITSAPTTATSTASASITLSPAPAASPLASGTIRGCFSYRQYIPVDGADSENSVPVNQCSYLASAYGVEVADILTWNPSLKADNCTLQTGYRYCVQKTQVAEGMQMKCLTPVRR